jgi:putative pyruvate formate lyase activating enzyme
MAAREHSIASSIAWFAERYGCCDICPENCRVDRNLGHFGLCGLGTEGRVYKEFVHFGEEPEVSPTHIIYLSGCNFRCRYCSDLDQVLRPREISETDPDWLAARIEVRRAQGARTVTFVGGTPDVQPLFILQVLSKLKAGIPIVWNSNLWLTRESLEQLTPFVDWFIPDVKYGPGHCDQQNSGASNTLDTLLANLGVLKENDVEVIVRHLLLPGHQECCTEPIMERLAKLWPGLRVNLMTAYRPFGLWNEEGALGSPLPLQQAEERVLRVQEQWGSSLALRKDGQALVSP